MANLLRGTLYGKNVTHIAHGIVRMEIRPGHKSGHVWFTPDNPYDLTSALKSELLRVPQPPPAPIKQYVVFEFATDGRIAHFGCRELDAI